MTFLQRILGRNYKWWYIVKYSFKQSSGDLYPFLFNTTVRSLEFLAFVFVWKLNGSNSQVISYLALGRVFDRLLFNEIDGQICSMITRGNLTRYLLLPSNFFGIMFCDNIGFNFFRSSINSFLTFSLSLIIFNKDIILSSNTNYLFLFFFVSYLLLTFISFIKGCIGFWWNKTSSSYSILEASSILIGMLSGSVIPLYILFGDFWNPILWNPFAFLLHHPMQIYLGRYYTNQILQTFAGGIAWCLVLWVLARLVFKAGLKRNEAVGL
jgi:ABC-2 type transport system permease protein